MRLARRFRFWQKKRGDRRTGSPLAGSVGEAIACTTILLVAFFAISALLASRWTEVQLLSSIAVGSRFWTAILVLVSMAIMGAVGLAWTVFSVTTSAERRRAIVDSARADGANALGPRTSRGPSPEDFPTIPSSENLYNSPGTNLTYRLPQLATPATGLMALALFCLLWIGTLGVLLVVVTNSFFARDPLWLALILTFVVAAVTVRVIQKLIIELGETLRIGPSHVEVSDAPFYPGQRYEVYLSQAGRMRLAKLDFRLAREEHAAYQEGTNFRKEVYTAFEQTILEKHSLAISPQAPFSHCSEFVIPENAIHSFQSSSNSIRWKLILRGEIIRGSTFERIFPILVYPAAPKKNIG